MHTHLPNVGTAAPGCPAERKLRNFRRAIAHPHGRGRPCPHARLASGEREVYLYLGLDFDRFSVEQVRLVLPLLHRFDCCRR